jgi:hypothetical protein
LNNNNITVKTTTEQHRHLTTLHPKTLLKNPYKLHTFSTKKQMPSNKPDNVPLCYTSADRPVLSIEEQEKKR